ncbi:MAG: thiamine pyrophosphate-binding protein [Deltaproteobacteria bacterium]|nr:thiamine pyrophosphate-binding protein [Deltaproteobacteria bacterium]
MITMMDAVRCIETHRKDSIVIASQSSRIPWLSVSRDQSLDILFAGSMSKESSVGLGIALACPHKKVIVLSGDGELLMNLGTLVTIANQAPQNYYHFVMQNCVYAFTGGQPIPGVGRLRFAGLAREAGYRSAYSFEDLEGFAGRVKDILEEKGPVFVCLQIEQETNMVVPAKGPYPWRPLREYLHGLREKLAGEATR